MSRRVEGKVAIVTGAGVSGEGIGNGMAAAILFAREGAKVLVVDIDAGNARRTEERITADGGSAATFVGDVASATDSAAMVRACIDTFGRVDVVHNNAGITGGNGGPVEQSLETWERVLAVNLTAIFLACKHALPHMVRQGGGSIVNISSVGGIRARIGRPSVAYSASKAGIAGLTRDVAIQYASRGIRCNTIVLGGVRTPRIVNERPGVDAEELARLRSAELPRGTMGDGWDTAYAALYLASDESRHVTGTTLVVDGGQSAAIRVAIMPQER